MVEREFRDVSTGDRPLPPGFGGPIMAIAAQ